MARTKLMTIINLDITEQTGELRANRFILVMTVQSYLNETNRSGDLRPDHSSALPLRTNDAIVDRVGAIDDRQQ